MGYCRDGFLRDIQIFRYLILFQNSQSVTNSYVPPAINVIIIVSSRSSSSDSVGKLDKGLYFLNLLFLSLCTDEPVISDCEVIIQPTG